MRIIDIERTAYPQLLTDLTDTEMISRYTLSPAEFELVRGYRGDKLTLELWPLSTSERPNPNICS